MLELLTPGEIKDLLAISAEPLGWDELVPGACLVPTFIEALAVELELNREFCWSPLLPGAEGKFVESALYKEVPNRRASGKSLLIRLLSGPCEEDIWIVSAELEDPPIRDPILPFEEARWRFCENWVTAGIWDRPWGLAEELICPGCTGINEDDCSVGW
jgi:hypothetical protein